MSGRTQRRTAIRSRRGSKAGYRNPSSDLRSRFLDQVKIMCDDTDHIGDSDTVDQPANTDTRSTTVRHNWEQSALPSVAIVEAVAAATDRATTDLPPLQETVDSGALDTLLDGQSPPVTVSFRYAGTGVSVSGDGSIEVRVDGRFLGTDDG